MRRDSRFPACPPVRRAWRCLTGACSPMWWSWLRAMGRPRRLRITANEGAWSAPRGASRGAVLARGLTLDYGPDCTLGALPRPRIAAMQIGQLAKRTGVPVDTIRYYENHHILPSPARHASG